MAMKNPPHPGELVRESIHDLRLTVSEVARGLGMTRQQLHNVMAGRSAVTAQLAVKLEKAFGSTADTWLAMQAAYDLAQARAAADLKKVPDYTSRLAEEAA
jgi:addiction module HigA family antidote